MLTPLRLFALAVIAAVALACSTSVAHAQPALREGFEGPETSWRIDRSDATYRVQAHRRIQQAAHTGSWCEFLQISAAANASHLFLVHEIGRAPVIQELSPAVWVKSNRSGPQLLARVVLPRNVDPQTGHPLTVLVRGAGYSQAGRWEELRINNILQQVEREGLNLRVRLGKPVDVREAYIDRLLLNVYSGAGVNQVWIDDLELSGYVGQQPARNPGNPPVGSPFDNSPKLVMQRPQVERNGSLLLVDGKPMFPRIIQYQGESLAFLKELGFNAVQLPEAPSPGMAREAARLRLWIIAPPPSVAPQGDSRFSPGAFGEQNDWVLAWDLGSGLTADQYEETRQWATQIRRLDSRVQRLLIADAAADIRSYSRHIDVLRPYRFPLGTSLELADYLTWLRERPQLARPGTPFWTTIQTELPWAVREQQRVLSAGSAPTQRVDADQMRMLVLSALAAGARGLFFQSLTRLDQDQDRAMALELINLELSLIQPWAAAGTLAATVTGSEDEVVAAVLHSERAKLLLPMWLGSGGQFVSSQASANQVKFTVPGVPESNSAYEITAGSMKRLTSTRKTGGLRVTLEEFGPTAMVMLSQDPLAITSLSRRVAEIRGRAAELQREIAVRKLSYVEALNQQLSNGGVPVTQSDSWLAAARRHMQQADVAAQRGNHETSFVESRRAMRAMRILERSHWDRAAERLGSPVASPLSVSSCTLSWHWDFLNKLYSSRTAPNQLPAGDCENLPLMLQAGWRHFRNQQSGLVSTADLSPDNAHTGGFSLRLRVDAEHPDAPPLQVESPPMWITTPPVSVGQAELVRIHGWVHVPGGVRGSVDGLMIIDSLAGPSLAERVQQTSEWQEFTLYRVAPRAGEVTVTFALTGLGQALVDDVTVEPVIPSSGEATAGGPPPEERSGSLLPSLDIFRQLPSLWKR